jgi:hypothetical protein
MEQDVNRRNARRSAEFAMFGSGKQHFVAGLLGVHVGLRDYVMSM